MIHDDPTINALAENAISKYTEWLTMWLQCDDPEFSLTRDDYDAYDDPPKALAYGSDQGSLDEPVLTLYVNPFHDEGGPHMLIVIGDWQDRTRVWSIIQHFDTRTQVIYQDGGVYVHTPEG